MKTVVALINDRALKIIGTVVHEDYDTVILQNVYSVGTPISTNGAPTFQRIYGEPLKISKDKSINVGGSPQLIEAYTKMLEQGTNIVSQGILYG